MSKLTRQSVENLTAVLAEGFVDFLNTDYRHQLDELFANASRDYIERELGELDGDLAVELQLSLMDEVW